MYQHPETEASVLAKDFEVSQATIIRLQKEFETARINGKIINLIGNADLIEKAGELLIKDAPDALVDQINGAAVDVANQISILETLQDDFVTTAQTINRRLTGMVLLTSEPSELQICAEILTSMQKAFFDKQITNFNTQNNFGDASLQELLDD